MAEIRIRNQGKITVQDADSSNEVSLQAPSTVASNTEFTLPSTSGNNNDYYNKRFWCFVVNRHKHFNSI